MIRKLYNHRLVAALLVLFWIFLYLTSASKIWFSQMRNQEVIDYGAVFLSPLLLWGIAILFIPAINKLAHRLPLDDRGWKTMRNFFLHLACYIFLLAIYVVLYRLGFLLITTLQQVKSSFWDYEVWRWIFFEADLIFFLVYWLVVIGVHLKRFYDRFREKQLLTAQMEAELSTASLNMLKNQLRPHFLFNTLHNINALMHENPGGSKKMIRLLQRLLSRSFQQTERQTVTLASELDFTNIYFQIENIRFYDGINIKQEIAPETLRARVPSLLLQPLAENAVRHGIAKKTTQGTIYLHSQKVNDTLQLVIEDNGPGMESSDAAFNKGIGLCNTRQRLQKMYKRHRFLLQKSDYGGLKVYIEIPFVKQAKGR